MADILLYGHDSHGERTGYQVLADSVRADDSDTNAEVIRRIESLRLRPSMLADRCGWLWIALDDGRRLFGRITLKSESGGSRTLSIRLVRLNESECRQLQWQPFFVASQMEDPHLWSLDDNNQLNPFALPAPQDSIDRKGQPSETIEFHLSWPLLGAAAGSILRQIIDGQPIDARRRLTFVAPAGVQQPDVAVQFLPEAMIIGQSRAQDTIPVSPRTGRQPGQAFRKFATATLLVLAISAAALAAWLGRENSALRGRLADQVGELQQKDQDLESLRTAINGQRPATEPAELSNQARLHAAELFELLYPERSTLPGRDPGQSWDQVTHYLRNDGSSLDELDLLENGLERWLEFEKLFGLHQQRLQRYRDMRGEVATDLDEFKDTIDQLRRTVDAAPDNSDALDVEGQIDRAKSALERLLNRFGALLEGSSGDSDKQSLPDADTSGGS